jgi:hypothetical protein
MATNEIFAPNPERIRDRLLSTLVAPAAPSTIQSGVPVLFAEGGAVSTTASGNGTVTVNANGTNSNLPSPLTSYTFKNGGVGNTSGSASFAFDGTWNFAVAGATTSTANGVEVFITPAGGLTLTSSTNVHYGWTDYPRSYNKVAGFAPVRIGK